MKKSLLSLLMISVLCFSITSFAEEQSNKGKVSEETKEYEQWLVPGETSTETQTQTTTATETKTETASDTQTETETQTETATSTKTVTSTQTQTSTDTDTKVSSSTSTDTETDPFSGDSKITEEVQASSTPTISDIETAKVCGIKEIGEGFPKDAKIASTGGDVLRLRSWPWGNVLGTYSEGSECKVLGESGEFYLVEINGTQGYMHKSYISTDDKEASGKAPYYPGSTRSGGALSLEEGVKASEDGAAGKVPTVAGGTPGAVTITGDKVVLDVPKKNQYQANTPAPGSSCGPTSLAMCLSFFGKGDPSVLVTDLYNVCGCTAANGTGHAGLEAGAHKYGLANAKFYYSVSQDWCRQQLKEGKPVLCHVAHHYVVMKGMDSAGNVILNDPAYNGVERNMSWSEFSVWWSNSGLGHSAMSF